MAQRANAMHVSCLKRALRSICEQCARGGDRCQNMVCRVHALIPTQAHIADRSVTERQRMRPRWSETIRSTYIRVPMRASALAYTVHLWIGTPSCPREQGSRRRTRVRSLDRVPVQRHEASCYTVMLPCSMVYNFEPEVPISETKHRRAEAEEDAIAQ